MINDLTPFSENSIVGYRLINAKFPPIAIFEDVAGPEEYEALYEIQALTNPRLKAEVGDLSFLPKEEIPFGIVGCGYSTAPFTHINPDGSRFSDGSFGLLYAGSCVDTAVKEVKYHQHLLWSNVPDLNFDRMVFKCLETTFGIENGLDASHLPNNDPIYNPNGYAASRPLGIEIKSNGNLDALRYNSVRNPGAACYALFTPRPVQSMIQSAHYEMIWGESSIRAVVPLGKGLF
ncbi:RES domain-containing protein [Exilibacterium tricleocarpae]|uniref:RES domain-containing protein n=1 Tax=Exilibacterium tricleocarpae TaxID=2591008 RepID=A0A545TZT2_9GAMM|nr:RES family NAD+ phosphorylase [Exilibacterium tricleocarpae]TQV82720.1 RES domain-containing protein [Exilibacterium tricleocarpae]